MNEIPIFQNVNANFTQEISLGGQLVQIQLVFNIRNQSWHMKFTDPNGDSIQGIKLVTNWPLFEYHKGFMEFEGDLMVRKTDEQAGDEITYDNLGNGWGLFYMTESEINDWKDENGF